MSDVLGYARVEGKWCLAVKKLRTVHGFYQGEMDCPYTNVFADGDPTPVLKTARETRLSAVSILPEFVASFTEKIGDAVGNIEVSHGKLFVGK